jgi:protein-export membrane protein SecD
MRHRLKIRWAIVGFAVFAGLWYLWPSVRFYSMPAQERREFEREDPSGFERLKSAAIKLGLDLQGGMHLVLELDDSERAFTGDERRDAVNRALEIIRNRVDQFGVSEPLIQKIGDDRIIVELPGIQDEKRAKDLVQRTAFLEFQLVAEGALVTDQIRAVDRGLAGRAPAETALEGDAETESSTEAAISDTTSGESDDAQTLEEFFGQDEPDAAAVQDDIEDGRFSALLQTEQVGADRFNVLVAEDDVPTVRALLADSAAMAGVDDRYEWLWSGQSRTFADGRTYRTLFLVVKEPEMTGEAISTAAAGFDPQFVSQPIVTLEMTGEGASTFGDVTGRHVNERLGIVLDNVVRMAPNIRQRISGGRAQIEGFDSIEEARDIAIVLRAGALPAPLEIIEERTVGPSLGADSIERGRRAGLLGLAVVALFMIVYYRVSGLVANVALAFNIVLILAALAAFGATLTLPGIAGLILTVGMAVDANVLVFERIREELDLGKSVRAAIDAGYQRALVTILDAQITTLIAAAVLFQFGTGPIKGFAVVLSIGILSSIFTAVFVTRTLFETWTQRATASRLSI